MQIDLDAIEPNPFNFRSDLSVASLHGLKESIRTRGLIHPLLVRPHPDPEKFGQYQLICGERRYSALKLLHDEHPEQWAQAAARVEPLDDTDALAAMLQENELREDWTPYERAAFFRAIYDDAHFDSIRQMAKALGIGLTTLHRYLRVFDLPETIIGLFRDNKLSIALMEVVLEAPADVRMDLAKHLAEHPCNKAQARRLAERMADPQAGDWIDKAVSVLAQEHVPSKVLEGGGLKLEITGNSAKELAASLKRLATQMGKLKP